MTKDEIIQILDDWNFWNRDQKTGVSRPIYISRLESLFSSNQVNVIMKEFAKSGNFYVYKGKIVKRKGF